MPDLNDLAAFTVSGAAGDTIFSEGDVSSDLYVVMQGQLSLRHMAGDTARQLATLEAGDFFGETSLLDGAPREVTATALTDYRVLRLDRATFDQLVRENPQIALRMLQRLSHQLRERLQADARAADIAFAPLPRAAAAPTVGAGVLVLPGGLEIRLAEHGESPVGRIDKTTGQRPTVDLTDLDSDRMLSRRHALIVHRQGRHYVREERASRNGTFVNGVRLVAGTDVCLSHGDEIRFAATISHFYYR